MALFRIPWLVARRIDDLGTSFWLSGRYPSMRLDVSRQHLPQSPKAAADRELDFTA
jgi:hypothetical protein